MAELSIKNVQWCEKVFAPFLISFVCHSYSIRQTSKQNAV